MKLSTDELIRRLHVVKDDKLHKGLDAFLIVWDEIPRYKILSKFARLPIIYHLGWLIYEFIALLLYAKNKNILKKVYE
jgi:predicted DCC family thiol-disulfide oxidoreductase YuxK